MDKKDFVIIVFAVIIGYLIYRLYCKRRQDIIKLQVYREKLPPPGNNVPWVQGGSCFMEDGTVGVVDSNMCQRISVL